MHRQTLNTARWTCHVLRAADTVPAGFPSPPIPAGVPGCIHSDLIRAGLICHPNVGDNEAQTQWVGQCDWQYRCEFSADESVFDHERIDLVFDALDTIASMTLNGTWIGRAANQFHPHRFDVRGMLRAGMNELMIDFESPIKHVRAEATRLGPRPVNGDWDPYVFIRKSASNFGWDWGPKVATVGVMGDVAIVSWNTARIASVCPLISRDPDGTWRVRARVRIDRAAQPTADAASTKQDVAPRKPDLKSEISDPCESTPSPPIAAIASIRNGGTTLAEQSVEIANMAADVEIQLAVRDIIPWMPRAHGVPALYGLTVELRQSTHNSAALDRVDRSIGFRTITLDTSPDEQGSRFTFRVNEKPVFVKGANWIPEGLFPEDRSPARIRERVQQAADANLNTLRVWGGGAYESDAFYDACDELGILVWQDFMFACACYPEEEPIRSQVEAEARYQIARLASHPSVALWCGGNECIWAWQGWGFAKRLNQGQTWGRGYWLDLLPRLCSELDPTRPYWPNTPWSGSLDADVQDPDHGTRHTWDKRVDGYRDIVPRFIAEFGHQSPPQYATILEACQRPVDPPASCRDRAGGVGALIEGPSEPADIAHELQSLLRRRQRAAGGDAERYDQPLAEHFRPAQDFDEWLYQSHLLQARAIALGIEWARIHRARCGGAVFWQWNDAWAGHSWSAVDWAGRRKPLWYAVRRACTPRLLTIQPIGNRPRLFAVNDAAEPWRGRVKARRVRFDGTVLAEADILLSLDPDRSTELLDLTDALGPAQDPARECLLAADALRPAHRADWHFLPDHSLDQPPPRCTARLETAPGKCRLTLTAETLMRDLVLAADRVLANADVDEQLISLLPGETATFVITCNDPFDSAAIGNGLLTQPTLRCAAGLPSLRRLW